MNKLIMGLLLLLVMSISVQAAEMNHSDTDHSKMNHSEMIHDTSLTAASKIPGKVVLQKLVTIPTSGKVREGGYDNRYAMESTDVTNVLSTRCAQASRGLVMMSNAEWSRCGGKPDGAVQVPQSATGKAKAISEHAGHNM